MQYLGEAQEFSGELRYKGENVTAKITTSGPSLSEVKHTFSSFNIQSNCPGELTILLLTAKRTMQ